MKGKHFVELVEEAGTADDESPALDTLTEDLYCVELLAKIVLGRDSLENYRNSEKSIFPSDQEQD